MGGNHPNNQTSEANQWPHHFEMLGQLLFGFIFLIVVAFLYIVRATPARFAREATTPLDVSLPGADLPLPGAPPSSPPDVLPSRQARRAPGADAKQAPRDRSDARRRGRGVGADARETLGAALGGGWVRSPRGDGGRGGRRGAGDIDEALGVGERERAFGIGQIPRG